ncbi:hypothetical protein M8C21_030676, partial [Ambrosia artemisiifolia]
KETVGADPDWTHLYDLGEPRSREVSPPRATASISVPESGGEVRDELEQLLDDDGDMAEMYLTDKLEQQLDNSSSSSSFVNEEDDMNDEILQTENDDSRVQNEGIMDGNENANLHEREIQQIDSQSERLFRANTLGRSSRGTRTSTTRSGNSKHLDIEELEMLLEAYFVQIDGTLNKLSTLREYVDDTEDYINIMLDDKQNHLLQMGVMLTTATLVVGAFVVVAGAFGMNITIELFDDSTEELKEKQSPAGINDMNMAMYTRLFIYAQCLSSEAP